jgi:hypothetical protein
LENRFWHPRHVRICCTFISYQFFCQSTETN